MNRRSIKISINMLKEASQNKDLMDVITFCLLIKLKSVSSVYKYHSYNELAASLSLSLDKTKKLFKLAQKHEMAYINTRGDIVVGKMGKSLPRDVNFKVSDIGTDTFKNTVKKLRQILLLTYIQNSYHIRNTVITQDDERISKKEYNKRKKKASAYVYDTDEKISGISLTKLCQRTGVKNRNTLVALIKELEEKNLIVIERYKKLLMKGENAYLFAEECRAAGLKVFLYKNRVYQVKANEYSLSPKLKSLYSTKY